MSQESEKLVRRGAYLLDLKKHDLAEKELRRAVAADPNDPDTHRVLAICLLRLATAKEDEPRDSREIIRVREARDEAQTAIGLDPHSASAFRVLAEALYYLHSHRQGEQAADEALRLEPDNPTSYSMRALFWRARKLDKKALDLAEQGLQRNPLHVGCLSIRIGALISLERYTAARTAIQLAMANYPDEAVFHRLMGQLNLFTGRPGAATPHLQTSLQRDPMDGSTQHNYELAKRLQREGNWEHVGKGQYRKKAAAAAGGAGIIILLLSMAARVAMMSSSNFNNPPPTTPPDPSILKRSYDFRPPTPASVPNAGNERPSLPTGDTPKPFAPFSPPAPAPGPTPAPSPPPVVVPPPSNPPVAPAVGPSPPVIRPPTPGGATPGPSRR